MEKKQLDLSRSVAELCKEFPELKQAMVEIGFKDITNPMALNTLGRIMTIPRGAMIKSIPFDKVLEGLSRHGFEAVNIPEMVEPKEEVAEAEEAAPTIALDEAGKARAEQLRSYIERLDQGESLESVQEDFKKAFSAVTPLEIATAEQSLIQGGVPTSKVQSLCDVHSALFHDHIAQMKQETEACANLCDDEVVANLTAIPGHPLFVLVMENRAIESHLDAIEGALADLADSPQEEGVQRVKQMLVTLKEIDKHYNKKADLLYNVLEEHGVVGPSEVMWGVDKEIRDEVSRLARVLSSENLKDEKPFIQAVFQRIREMFFKEENILFPLTAQFFTDAQWALIYKDFDEFGYCLLDGALVPKWRECPSFTLEEQAPTLSEGKIQLPTGEFTVPQLIAVLDALPIDITFVDAEDKVRFFTNKGERAFPRPMSALGREVYKCHSPKTVEIVRTLIDDLKARRKTQQDIWLEKNGRTILVRYIGVYDANEQYLGVIETSENMSPHRAHLLGEDA